MADSYRIGEVANMTGFPPSTLRFYEDEGLLPSPARTAAGQRRYDREHIDRLRFMSRAKRLGRTLGEIADLADAWDHEQCSITHEQLVDLLDAKLGQVHDQIAELTRFGDQRAAIHQRVTGSRPHHGGCGPGCGCASAARGVSPGAPDRPFGNPAGHRRLSSALNGHGRRDLHFEAS